MKANDVLQVIYAFFLGLVVLAFVAIGINTFHPQPQYPRAEESPSAAEEYQRLMEAWQLTTSIILLVAATVILAVSLFRAAMLTVISNGLLLGGIFTMVYAVGMSLAAPSSVLRFVVATFALAITVAVGYLTFRARGTRAVKGGVPAEATDELAGRVGVLESQLDALRRAQS